MWDLIVSVPDHCLSFYFETSVKAKRMHDRTNVHRTCRWMESWTPISCHIEASFLETLKCC